jgi:cholesterol transport system auxiliary component
VIARRRGLWVCLVILVSVATGCSLTRPPLDRHTFALSVESLPPVHKPAVFPATLKVGRISMQPPYGGTSLVYRAGDLRYEVDPYNGFVASPGDLLGHEIARWLGRVGLFTAVREPASPLTGDFVLEGLVTELYGDTRDPQKPVAVLSIQISMRRASAEGGVVFEQAYAQRVAIENASPEALVRGYGTALGKVLDALERDLAVLKLGG